VNVWLVMAVAGLLTFGIRLSFIALQDKVKMPAWFQRSLRFVPVAVLSAIIVPGLFERNGVVDISAGNPQVWAGLAAIIVAWLTKNVLLTIAAGMAAMVALQFLLG
jgi:branched-subunit amino acid transport protein